MVRQPGLDPDDTISADPANCANLQGFLPLQQSSSNLFGVTEIGNSDSKKWMCTRCLSCCLGALLGELYASRSKTSGLSVRVGGWCVLCFEGIQKTFSISWSLPFSSQHHSVLISVLWLRVRGCGLGIRRVELGAISTAEITALFRMLGGLGHILKKS